MFSNRANDFSNGFEDYFSGGMTAAAKMARRQST